MKNRQQMHDIAVMTAEMIFEAMPESKKETFRNACYRNLLLTSYYGLGFSTVKVYKEGFYITMEGTRCSFAAFAKDNDGELEITRKPNDSKLHYLWGYQFMNEMPVDPYKV